MTSISLTAKQACKSRLILGMLMVIGLTGCIHKTPVAPASEGWIAGPGYVYAAIDGEPNKYVAIVKGDPHQVIDHIVCKDKLCVVDDIGKAYIVEVVGDKSTGKEENSQEKTK